MTLIVTGAAGFIGANLVKALNERGETRIIAVDNLSRADKFRNLVDCEIDDYLDKTEFVERFQRGDFGKVRAVFHEGACSDTMETDGRYMMDNNFRYSRAVLSTPAWRTARSSSMPRRRRSTAARRASSRNAKWRRRSTSTAIRSFLFDQVIRRVLPDAKSQIAGFRYFNVYGPRETHKGRMASVAFHNFNQFRAEGKVKLFGEYNGYAAGEQTRDFVSVEDVVKVNLFFFDHPEKSGIFNLGTGRAQPFNDIASSVVNTLRVLDGQPPLTLAEQVAQGLIEYVPFPDALRGKYQCFTQADQSKLRAAGYDAPFLTVQEGVDRYVRWLFGQL